MQSILFVSHCILNTAARWCSTTRPRSTRKKQLRRRFVGRALETGVQLIQLPCPEFTLYGRAPLGPCERPV